MEQKKRLLHLHKLRPPQVEHELREEGHVVVQAERGRVVLAVVSEPAAAQRAPPSEPVSLACICRSFPRCLMWMHHSLGLHDNGLPAVSWTARCASHGALAMAALSRLLAHAHGRGCPEGVLLRRQPAKRPRAHRAARRMRVRSIQRVASKSSSVSILNVASRATTTAAASWSNPATSSPRFAPSVHLAATGRAGRRRNNQEESGLCRPPCSAQQRFTCGEPSPCTLQSNPGEAGQRAGTLSPRLVRSWLEALAGSHVCIPAACTAPKPPHAA